MGRVLYDNKRLVPAPFVSIDKQYQTTGDGEHIGTTYNINITGTLVSFNGSPTSSGTFHTGAGNPSEETIAADARLASILRKQDAIRDLFSTEGKQFEVQSLDGSQPLKCNPRVLGIQFQQGTWFDRCEYTINLQADILYPEQEDTFSEYISSASESWSIETDETPENENSLRTYRLSHNISAQGKRFYDNTATLTKDAWKWARDWVQPKLGFDSVLALSSGVNNLPDYYGGFNHLRSENIDEDGGTYSVTETWVLASGTALESFEVSTTESLDQPYDTVSINGNIQGLEVRDSDLNLTTSKYDNASAKFDSIEGIILTRAQNISGKTLNISPVNKTIGRNTLQGFVSYNYDYDTRPSAIISGARTESISITDAGGGDVFASIAIPGRANQGPILQDLNTKEATTRTLTIDLVMEPASLGTRSETDLRNAFFTQRPDVSSIVRAADPANQGFSVTFSSNPTENWSPLNGTYNLSRTWTYE